ncbi:2-polyprenyl-6-methoxyphenol hydroxylase-like FAD-dependent oxidoreductase [Nocardioides zeae]|uniref:2-polyprenyl-6-methoxyphenol hydroxylase-like FAD-dependent oxidoreductase n=1 Tax=Nocardioides zeae TaxID=1457234 RepID=A0ACC6IFD2_9ACTN|nr:FAD-dependent oxidoreductase [Nocardioides zeae]MDR6174867.1 2-polyprenyl-6-methoxyphenol hydroxylase-like FAD-dependent oxidoreductase [Nocardioides zeae]MDR6209323.1 2-polyprenyl-6-methoxyphenol hydroxylase-like FAD-dependent oxidoreductase [Nocardioides zeae]
MSATPSPAPPIGRHAEVVGGGIGGLTAAAALARRGWSVRLHERNEAVRALGSGIYLWSNGLAVLDELGVLDRAISDAHYGPSIQTRTGRGDLLVHVPVNGEGQVKVLTIMRERLISALLHAATSAGVEVVCDSTATGVTPSGRLTFADGSTSEADLVVIADGVGSRLRDSLGLLRRRRPLGQRCARVVVPRQPGLVPDADADSYIEWMSGRRFLLYTPSSKTDAYIALVCPRGDDAAIGDPVPIEEWTKTFPQARNLIEQLGPAPRWDEFEQVELTSWSAGKVAVLGDAAHAQPPYLGQGGGCAMMSALGLAVAVSGDEDLAGQLAAWEQTERPLISHTQRFSFRVGRLNDLPSFPRALLLRALGRSRAFAHARLRAANAVPTGTRAAVRS